MIQPFAAFTKALAGRYDIERELGQGGMATVYLAHDRKHDRKVALKVLKPELAAVLGAERFVAEIRTTAALQHPHILPLFDSGTADGFLYYVMPFIDGETLRAKLDRETQLGVDEAVKVATAVADALDYAHRRGVIHRDIKPENILLHDGRPIVADFGIALAVSAAAGGRMTETGLSLGTPHYMSPEQATAEKEITARSDVYSLGSVVYEMLAGQPPHLGGSAQQIIMKIITETPQPVTQYRKSVPLNVAATLAKALEKLPADRFESAAAFGAALNDVHYARPDAAAVSTAGLVSSRWKPVAIGASAVALVLAVLAVWGWQRPTPAIGEPWRVPIALPDSAVPGGPVTISRDGGTLIYVSQLDGRSHLFRFRPATGHAEPIPGTAGAITAAISPDGRRVGYKSAAGILVVPIEGGTPTLVARTFELTTPLTWLDEDHLLYDGTGGVFSVPVNGGTSVRLTTLDTGAAHGYHVFPAPLPAGAGIVFTIVPVGSMNASEFRIAAAGLDGGDPVVVTTGTWARYAESGHLLVRRGDGTIVAMPFDARRFRVTGREILVVAGLSPGAFAPDGMFDVSAAGRLVYSAGFDFESTELVVVDRAGVATPLAPGWHRAFQSVAVSPDGRRIAAGAYTPAGEEVQVRELATGSLVRIARPDAQIRSPAWAPDGRTLFYVSLGTRRHAILRTAPEEVGVPEQVLLETSPDSVVGFLAPFPDGTHLYYTQLPPTRQLAEIRVLPLAGSASSSAAIVAGQGPELSPDGRWLAWQLWTPSHTTQLVRSTDPARGEQWQVSGSVREGRARWSRDGRALYFVARDSMQMATVEAGRTFRVVSTRALFPAGQFGSSFDLLPDGRFVMIRLRSAAAAPMHIVMLEDWTALLRARRTP